MQFGISSAFTFLIWTVIVFCYVITSNVVVAQFREIESGGEIESEAAVQCPAIQVPVGAVTEGNCRPGVVGSPCLIRCNRNLVLDGQPVIVCLPSGSWSDHPPTCRRSGTGSQVSAQCPALNAPPGGRLIGSCTQASVGDTCQLVCISGYRPTDIRVLVCRGSGSWSAALPSCVVTGSQCPSIVIVEGGSTSGTCSPGVPGQSCTVSCLPGYQLTAPPTVTCQNSGSWSGVVPACQRGGGGTVCPALAAPANGIFSGSCTNASPGQTCNFACNPGFRLIGSQALVCLARGAWSASPPSCTASACPALTPPPNGILSGSCTQASPGQLCTFSCQAGFTLVGQSTLVCQGGGSWSGAPPTCSRGSGTTCQNLYAPDHGYLIGTCAPGQVGQTCVFGCEEGYNLEGRQVLQCQASGSWQGNPPTCERGNGENCPSLIPPEYGEFVECDNRIGGRCIVVCQRGYVRSGSRVRTCLVSGVWSGYAPVCTRRGVVGYKIVPLWTLLFG